MGTERGRAADFLYLFDHRFPVVVVVSLRQSAFFGTKVTEWPSGVTFPSGQTEGFVTFEGWLFLTRERRWRPSVYLEAAQDWSQSADALRAVDRQVQRYGGTLIWYPSVVLSDPEPLAQSLPRQLSAMGSAAEQRLDAWGNWLEARAPWLRELAMVPMAHPRPPPQQRVLVQPEWRSAPGGGRPARAAEPPAWRSAR